MSDAIKHECGIALIRLLKPLSYYHRKYGSAFYGFINCISLWKNSITADKTARDLLGEV